ncbi:type I methionyl aminopeptidase [Patescibacteria group bacterium]|nr:type I methionyl aminopeptidase [Patescibacteria group bacterium]
MIIIKSKKEIAVMREGGKILAEIMRQLEKAIFPGQNTEALDKLAARLVFVNGGEAVFKNFGKESGHPYPGNICASLNNEIVHGIPDKKRKMQKGDILKIDIGMRYQGMITDMARTFLIGPVSEEARKLAEATEQAFWEGMKKIKAGTQLSDYSCAVQKFIESQGFSVVRNLVGHGVGRELHEDPYVPNYYTKKDPSLRLEEGMTLALEPMVNAGSFHTVLAKNGWVFKTKDGQLSAHYENTIVVTKNGAEVLTVF